MKTIGTEAFSTSFVEKVIASSSASKSNEYPHTHFNNNGNPPWMQQDMSAWGAPFKAPTKSEQKRPKALVNNETSNGKRRSFSS